MTTATETRLEYLRGQIRAESISYGEIAELQDLAAHIDPGDVELLQWAGVPEYPEHNDYANPYTEGTTDYRIWLEGASTALTAVQIVGVEGGEYVTNLVMGAEEVLGLVTDETLDSDDKDYTDEERDAGTF